MPSQNIKESIYKTLNVTGEINNLLKQIYQIVELTNIDPIEKFNHFNEPNITLSKLLNFYNSFLSCLSDFENIKNIFFNLSGDSLNFTMEIIIKENLYDKCISLYKICDTLNEYDTTNISNELIKDITIFRDKVTTSLSKVYFSSLLNNKYSTKDLYKISEFLLNYINQKSFLKEYSSVIYEKANFDKDFKDSSKESNSSYNTNNTNISNTNNNNILDSIYNIDNYLINLNTYNKEVLGSYGNSINIGLNKLLIINIKKILINILLIIEKKEDLEEVPFLIKLNDSLKHNTQKNIKEVEDLYIFKNEINKIICNLFLIFTEQSFDTPNIYCDIEPNILKLRRALDHFKIYGSITSIFIKNYGPFFKIQKFDEFCTKMSRLAIDSIIKVSDKLPDLKRNIYLINNLYVLQDFVKDIKPDVLIKNNIDNLIDIFNKEMNSRSNTNLSSFVDKNLDSLETYFLPDEIRDIVIPRIKKCIWEGISTEGYNGNQNTLNDRINNIFTSK